MREVLHQVMIKYVHIMYVSNFKDLSEICKFKSQLIELRSCIAVLIKLHFVDRKK